MTWDPLSKPQDKAEINGIVTPGVCEVIGAHSPRKWDKQSGPGYSGAWLIYHGTDLSDFSIVCRLYTDDDWLEWDALRPMLTRPPIGSRPKAMSVVHPVLDQVGVISMVVEDVMAPQQTGPGEWTIEIRCIEWRGPKAALSKPDAAAATPLDPVEQEIKLKRQHMDDLANEPP